MTDEETEEEKEDEEEKEFEELMGFRGKQIWVD